MNHRAPGYADLYNNGGEASAPYEEEDDDDLDRYFKTVPKRDQNQPTREQIRQRIMQTDFGSRVAYFYQEGEIRNPPTRLILTSQRYPTMEILLNTLNNKIHLPRGVRAIFSPHGRHAIESMEDIDNDGHYICSSNLYRGIETDIKKVNPKPTPWHLTIVNKDRHPTDEQRSLYAAQQPSRKRERQGDETDRETGRKRNRFPDILPRYAKTQHHFRSGDDDRNENNRTRQSFPGHDKLRKERSKNGFLPRLAPPRKAWGAITPKPPPERQPIRERNRSRQDSLTGGRGRGDGESKSKRPWDLDDDRQTPGPNNNYIVPKGAPSRSHRTSEKEQPQKELWPTGIGYRGDDYVIPPGMYQQNQRKQALANDYQPTPRRKMKDYGRVGADHNQQWTVRLISGDMPNGASTSTIMLTMYGQSGVSPTFTFEPKRKAFLSGSTEAYPFVRLPSDIGDIYKIRLEISNSGSNPDWLCEEVQLEDEISHEVLHFPCRRWLSSTIGDRHIVREVPALTQDRPPVALVHYELTVQTGNMYNAGTTGNVTVVLFGERGDSGPRLLKNPINQGKTPPFGKNQSDVFILESVSLGELRRLRVQHEPESQQMGWYLENVIVREKDLHATFVFGAGRWINARDEDRQLIVDLKATDFLNYNRHIDKKMWPTERWKFKMPSAELVLFSCVSNKPLRMTNGGFIDSRAEPIDLKEGNAVFIAQEPEDQDNEAVIALKSAAKASSFIAFSNSKIVSKAGYTGACDLRLHVSPAGSVSLESDKYPSNFISVASNGQMYPETQVHAQQGPNQTFFCYVKGCFRDQGIIMLCSSRTQTLCIDRDPSAINGLGGRNRLAHFRVHKVAVGNIRMFESLIFPGNYLQIKQGICNCLGTGDRFCEFKVRRFREQNFIVLESLREQGYLSFALTGRMQVQVEHSFHVPPSNCRLYPEVVEFGKRKGDAKNERRRDPSEERVDGAERMDADSQMPRSKAGGDPDSDLNSEVDDLYRDRYRGKPGRKVPVTTKRAQKGDDPKSNSKRIQKAPVQPSEASTTSRPQIKGLKPTLNPAPNFVAKDDCTLIRKCVTRGDLESIFKTLTRRSNDQRILIEKSYKAIFKKDIIEDIETIIKNDVFVLHVLPDLFVPYITLAVNDINKALQGDVDEMAMIDMICSHSDIELHQIKLDYQKKFGQALDSTIMSSMTTSFTQRLLVRLLARPQSTTDNIVQQSMESDAKTLNKFFGTKVERPEDHFLFALLAGRSHAELKVIFDSYKKFFNHDVEDDIKEKIGGEAAQYLTATVRCITKMQTYFAERINDCLTKGSDRAVDRIILSRCEVDAENIKEEFAKLFTTPLTKKMALKFADNHLKALLCLLNDDATLNSKPGRGGAAGGGTGANNAGGQGDAVPTVFPFPGFNAKKDSELLATALKNGNKSPDAVSNLITILTKRSWQQRYDIAKSYKDVTKKDLEKDIDLATSGFFSKLMLRLLKQPFESAASDLNAAIRASDEKCLIDIICMTPHEELQLIKEKYQKLFGKTLQKELDEANEPTRKLMVAILNRPKAPSDSTTDEHITAADATSLHEEITVGEEGVDYLTKFFTSNRTATHMRAVFSSYKTAFHNEIEDDISKRLKGDISIAFRALVSSVKNKPQYFAKRINAYLNDKENTNAALCRIIASRCEVDLGSIKAEYTELIKKDLASDVQTRITPEEYVQALVSLINGNKTAKSGPGGTTAASGPGVAEPPPNLATVFPEPKFNAKEDCVAIQKGMKGAGTNENVLTDILTKRSWPQRAEIEKIYKEQYKKELEGELESEISGNYLKVLLKLLKVPAEMAARDLNAAIQAKDYDTLIEIICTTPHAELQEIKGTYEKLFNNSLQKDIEAKTDGDFEKILVSLINRPKSPEKVDPNESKEDAKEMHTEIEADGKNGVRHLTELLSRRGQAQLRSIFDEYKADFGAHIEEDVKKHLGGELEQAFLAIIGAIRNKPKYFASRLNASLNSTGGANHGALIRQIVSRCEIDLGNVKYEFEKMFGKTLVKVVELRISGDYRTAIISLINGNKQPPANDAPPPGKPAKQAGSNKDEGKTAGGSKDKKQDAGAKDKKEDGVKAPPQANIVFIPTVVPEPKFDAKKDCEKIMNAMKGVGTNEEALTEILTKRSWKQRAEIEKTYQEVYKKNMEEEIDSEVDGNYFKTLQALLKTPAEHAATCLKEAMKGAGYDEVTLVEVICSALYDDLQLIKEKYNELYKVTLQKDIESETKGAFQKLLVALINRPKSPANVDLKAAKADAKTMHDEIAKSGQQGADHLIKLFSSYGQSQLQLIFDFYKQDFKTEVDDDIKKQFDGDLQDAFLATVGAIRNKPQFVAKRLQKSMEGAGTKDEHLIRLIVSRCEIDLGNIKTEYEKLYGKTLVKAVESETNGSYQKALISLINGNNTTAAPLKKPEPANKDLNTKKAGEKTAGKTEGNKGDQPAKTAGKDSEEATKITRPSNPASIRPVPTVVAEPKFDVKKDCEALKQAIHVGSSAKADEDAITGVLTKRSWQQRSEIIKTCKDVHKMNLEKEVKDKSSGGNYFKVISALLTPPIDLAANYLNNAMKGAGTDEAMLIEIICSQSHPDLQLVKDRYQKLYNVSLQKDVEGDTRGSFQKLLVGLINRPKSPENIDQKVAKIDAKMLHEAVLKGGDSGSDELTRLFANRGQTQLRLVFDNYKAEFKADIEEDIQKHFKSDLRDAFVSTVEVIRNKYVFYAKRFNQAMEGSGTRDEALIRLVVSRCEIDLGSIKQEFEKIYKKPLVKTVEGETSGSYRTALISLLNGNHTQSAPSKADDNKKAEEKHNVAKDDKVPAPVKSSPDGPFIPTIVAEPKFDAKKDAEAISKAMKGIGTDEASLSAVLTKRSWQQRAEIEKVYQELYKKELTADIKSEVDGNYSKLMIALLQTPSELAAVSLNGAIKGGGTDEATLIEILCTKPYADLQLILKKYENLYKKSLQKDIEGDTSGAFCKLLVALINRPKSPSNIDVKGARADAKEMQAEIAKGGQVACDYLTKLFSSRGQAQLRLTFDTYENELKAGHIEDDIKNHFSSDIQQAFLAVVGAVRNKVHYFAQRFNAAMEGSGTRDEALIRVVVSRCEYDLGSIKAEYEKLYKKPLVKAVESETSGDYQVALVSLINGNHAESAPSKADNNKKAEEKHNAEKKQQPADTKPAPAKEKDKDKVKQETQKKDDKAPAPVKSSPDGPFIPTVIAEPKFDAKKDAEAISKAMKGIGTDEASLSAVLTKRSWQQRAEIEKAYQELYKKELIADINSEVDGNYLKLIQSLLKTPTELAAVSLNGAIKGGGTDEATLIEILCTKPYADLQMILGKYENLYKKSLQKDIEGDTSGAFCKLLVALIKRPKSPSNIDVKGARADAKEMQAEIAKGGQVACDYLTKLFSSRGQAQLRLTFDIYENELKAGHIEDDIKKHFSSDIQQAFLAVVGAVRNKVHYFAQRFNAAMEGSGTRDEALIRVVVSRCEYDLGSIKAEYEKLYKKPLVKAVEGETSGDYQVALVSLINGNNINNTPTHAAIDKEKTVTKVPAKASEKAQEKPPEKTQTKPQAKKDDEADKKDVAKVEEKAEKAAADPSSNPTVAPEKNFSVGKDCEALMNAMKGAGSNKDAITAILTKRSWQQRAEIETTYKATYKKDLEDELKGEVEGNYLKLVHALLKTPAEYSAREINSALKGANTVNEDTLIELICSKSHADLQLVKEKYQTIFGKSMQNDVESGTSGTFKALLVALINRPKSPETKDPKAAKADAKIIHDLLSGQDADKGKKAAEELTKLIANRGQSQLRLIFDTYQNELKADLEADIVKYFDGSIEKAFVAVVAAIRNKPLYFAKRLNAAMEGAGTRDDALIRLIVSRCEIDLGTIKQEFEKLYKKPLVQVVESETSGDYKKGIASLIIGNTSGGPSTTAQPADPKATPKPAEKQAPAPEKKDVKAEKPTEKPAENPSSPTLVPDKNFNAAKDCETLMKAMKGIGTNETAITEVLTKRSWQQRAEIETTYMAVYKKDLEAELKSEVDGNYLKLVHALLKTPNELAAREINTALKGAKTINDDTLIELICTKSHADLQAIKEKYQSIFGKTLQSDVESGTNGPFQALLVALINRPKSPETKDPKAAKADAKIIHDLLSGQDADKGKKAAEELTKLIANRGQSQLRLIFDTYQTEFKADLEADIVKYFDGSIEKAFVAVVAAIRNKPFYFAKRLNAAMEGSGTRDDALIRLIVSRCEIDLGTIKQEFEKLYKKQLVQVVESEASGIYKKALVSLVHGNIPPPNPNPNNK